LHVGLVHTYWPIEQHREVDTRPFVDDLVRGGLAVALPVVQDDHAATMTHRVFSGPDQLVPNRFGGHQPAHGRRVLPSEMDLVVVPAMAADRRGFRLGFGFGFYDRFLAEVRCPTVCVVYSECLVEHIPEEGHDVPVQFVVTELETIVTGAPAT
jgi:5-formyltetrahydrofolate cyclo-ligase